MGSLLSRSLWEAQWRPRCLSIVCATPLMSLTTGLPIPAPNFSQRFSTLTQITTGNVRQLQLQWVYQAQSAEPSDTKFEATPLVVDGVMYTVRPPNGVVALDAATGQVRWTKVYSPAAVARTCCGRVNRGLAVLDDMLFMGTIDGRLLAISAADGRTVWNVPAGRPEAGYSITHAPLVVNDTVIVGPAGGEFGIRGFLAAFDVKTGNERWRFYPVPGPGEPGSDSWSCARHFLTRRHKVPTRGTRRFPAEQVFGPLGVIRLRPLHVGARSCASA